MENLDNYPLEIEIDVTQEDINAGIPRNAMYCPISRAIWKKFKKPSSVCFTIKIYEEKQILYDLPQEAIEFRTRFDTGLSVIPFRFKTRRLS